MSIQFPEEDKCQEPYQYFSFARRAVNYIDSLLQNPNIPLQDAGRSSFRLGCAPPEAPRESGDTFSPLHRIVSLARARGWF
jgi:hypothetical protein